MAGKLSKILSFLLRDDPLVQDAAYRLDAADRQYIDSQILGTQQHVVDSLVNGVHGTWFQADPALSAALQPGDVVGASGSGGLNVTLFTSTSVPALAGAKPLGVVLKVASPGARVHVGTGGLIDKSTTGLATTAGLARVSAGGRVERIDALADGDVGLGSVDAAGVLSFATAQTFSSTATATGVHLPVKAAATGNTTRSGAQTIDGVACGVGDRVLLPAQTDGATNGIYVIASGAWTRAADANTSALVLTSMTVGVQSGAVNGGKTFILVTQAPIILGTTALRFIQQGTTIDARVLAAADDATDDTANLQGCFVASPEVVYSAGTYLINPGALPAIVTIGSTLKTHRFARGAKIHVPAGVTLIVAGTRKVASNQQIFQCDPSSGSLAAGAVVFADYGQVEAHPEEFGADPTGTADSSAAIVACANAVNGAVFGGGAVQFGKGAYRITTLLFANLVGVTFKAAARYGTRLWIDNSALASDNVVFNNCNTCDFSGFRIEHPALANKTGGAMVKVVGCDQFDSYDNILIGPYKGLEVQNRAHGGLHFGGWRIQPGAGTNLTWHSGIWIRNAAGVWLDDMDVNYGFTVALLLGGIVLDSNVDTPKLHKCASNQVGTPSLPNTNGGHGFRCLNSWMADSTGLKLAVNSANSTQTYNAPADLDGRLGKLGELDPRHLTFTTTGADSNFVDGSHVTFHGLDQNGAPLVEAVTLTTAGSPGTFTTTGLFTKVTQIVVDAQGTYTDGTIAFGVAEVVYTNVGASEAAFAPRWIEIVGMTTEGVAGHGHFIEQANNLEVFGGTAASSTNGLLITGGSNISYYGGFFINNANHGIEVLGGVDVNIYCPKSTGNSTAASNTYSGIVIGGGTRVRVWSPVVGDVGSQGVPARHMKYGIHITGGVDVMVVDPSYGPLTTDAPAGMIETALFLDASSARTDVRQRARTERTAAPTTGTWSAGDVVFNSAPSDGAPAGWICSVAGTPGTWLKWYATSLAAPTAESTASSIAARGTSGETAFQIAYAPSIAAKTLAVRALGVAFFPGGTEAAAASSGCIRTEKQAQVWTYQGTDGVTRIGLQIDGADDVQLGNDVHTTLIDGSSIQFRPLGTLQLWVTSTVIQARVPISVDTINEKTVSAGVNIQGFQIDTSGNAPTKYRQKYIQWDKDAADGAAATATAEHVIFRTVEAITITGCKYEPDGALAASNTDNAVFTVRKRNGAGGAATSMVSNTTSLAGTGNWSAFVTVAIDSGGISNASVAAGSIVTVEIAKNGAGVQVPSGKLIVDYTVN